MKSLIRSRCITALVFLEASRALGAVYAFVPPDPGPGNSSLAAPFRTSTSSRLQQVYAENGFPPVLPTSAFLIQGIYFQVDQIGDHFDETFPSVQVNLSTTSREPDGLSTVFSENIGPDETVVFGPGPLHLSGTQPGFTVGFLFERSYLYDPATGNLLLDIRNFGPGNASELDAFDTAGDSVSIVLGRADATSGFGTSSRGLATAFWVDIVLIPEPSASALLFMGLLAITWRLRRRTRAIIPKG